MKEVWKIQLMLHALPKLDASTNSFHRHPKSFCIQEFGCPSESRSANMCLKTVVWLFFVLTWGRWQLCRAWAEIPCFRISLYQTSENPKPNTEKNPFGPEDKNKKKAKEEKTKKCYNTLTGTMKSHSDKQKVDKLTEQKGMSAWHASFCFKKWMRAK